MADMKKVYIFGNYKLEEYSAEPDVILTLRRGGEVCRVGSRPLQVLHYFVQRPNQVISINELLGKFWGPYGEGALRVTINRLRRSLGSSSDKDSVIRNIPSTGYTFILDVTEISDLFTPHDPIWDVGFPLMAGRMTAEILGLALLWLSGKDREGLERYVDKLTMGARHFGLSRRYYEWLNAFFDIPKQYASEDVQTNAAFRVWYPGWALYRGSLAHRLPIIGQVAFTLGKRWRIENHRQYWSVECVSMYKELALSVDFFDLIKSPIAADDICDALLHELLRLDERRSRRFLKRHRLSEAITRGFEAINLFNILPGDEAAGSQFIASASKVVEYILSEFGDADEAIELTMMVGKTLDNGHQCTDDMLDMIVNNIIVPLLTRARTSGSNTAKAFLLGMLIGWLYQDGKIEMDAIHEVKTIANQLGLVNEIKRDLYWFLDTACHRNNSSSKSLLSFRKNLILFVDRLVDSFIKSN
jgi:DNA-binding winged helix-turn-helix (wHTH) protein